MDRQLRVTTERDTSTRVVETIHSPTYQNSQRSPTSAPENIEHAELYDDSLKTLSTSSSPTSLCPSPTWQEVLRSSTSDRSNTLVSSRPHSVAFSWTHTIPPKDEEQPGLELTKDLDAGLETVPYDGNFDKEVYIPEERDMMEKEVVSKTTSVKRTWSWRRNFLFGLQRKWCLWAAACILLIALGIGIGAGVAVKISQNQHTTAASQFKNGGHLDPKFLSTNGAFNGSGLAAACQTFPGHVEESVVLYYQHHTGTIRWKYMEDENWLGGTNTEIVAHDAKNGTPISAVAYEINEISTWHVFYLDTENFIKQKSNDNITNQWRDGEINSLQLKAMNSDAVGMGACWYGKFYNDTDYINFKPTIATADPYNVGMRIWFASNATTFQQYGWREGDTAWNYQQSWNGKNGHAGIGCYSWDTAVGSTTYVMMLNHTNVLEIWWKDTDATQKSTPRHPINKWTNAPVHLPFPIDPTSSLSYTQVLYAQSPITHQFHTYNITFGAEATFLGPSATADVSLPPPLRGQIPGIPGGRMTSSEIIDKEGNQEILVFYQMAGNDLVGFSRDVSSSNWAIIDINVQDLASASS